MNRRRSEMRNENGFSLIETMIVVVIISILATMAKVSYERYIHRARVAQVTGFAAQFEIYFEARSGADGIWRMQDVTGNGCSACGWFGAQPLMTDPNVQALWKKLGYDEVPMDGWGRGYVLDENEGEGGPADCRPDTVISGGPNGLQETVSGGGPSIYSAVGDDIIYVFKRQRNPACNGVIVW